jgi:lysophospholipase L1-like esterase
MIKLSFFLLMMSLISCEAKENQEMIQTTPVSPGPLAKYTYLALGDSYTIGQSVSADQSFPYQLQKKLQMNDRQVGEPVIIARTGWTCDDLMSAINAQVKAGDQYQLVTLLIGVNDQYRGYNVKDYPARFKALLQKAISLAGNNPQNVIVVSIPDYGATPYGAGSAGVIGNEIDAYNAINKAVSEELLVNYVNITDISRMGLSDPGLVARDDLHPSGKMYGLWIDRILPVAIKILK